ncbi:glycosyl hydrolase family 18 protein [Paenibacillus sp. MMS18-CY102]|uniref:glycosyl hydrolase family 18 protein n=1 Tax=Paenibacillus sp. MMS18-CY102 TaxID=2682849 RepID=UPI001F0006A4|nr:glycosyl hydrolase family 18 protein [Paenibacillus sp. MMS18-CY102]
MQLKHWIAAGAVVIALQAGSTAWASAAASTKMTQYRVYQNDSALKEFADYNQAIAYAKSFAYSHVEKISGRYWKWDNIPRFAVYQNGVTKSSWQFKTYNDALKLAKTMRNVYIRDLQQPGWAYSQIALFQLYQGDVTKPNWSFPTLAAAKKEAAKWSNAHVIDLTTKQWVWSNLTAAQKQKQQAGPTIYTVTSEAGSEDGAAYAFLYDAIQAAAKIPNSQVINSMTNTIVHSNAPAFEVHQNGRMIGAYTGLLAAVNAAKPYSNAQVMQGDKEMWTNIPYLGVYQGDAKIGAFHTIGGAVAYASKFAHTTVTTTDGHSIWSNVQSLAYLGWNGTAAVGTIQSQLANTQGLDITSPTWFSLKDGAGTLTDLSNNELAASLHSRGLRIWPLVHNDFDAKRTNQFLSNPQARQQFVQKLVSRLKALGAEGVNLDFEGVAASNRASLTSFVSQLTSAAHAQGLKVSIDLLRGDIAWNNKTAYDIEAIGKIVDTVIIMAYDQYWQGSDTPGSVAGLDWVKEGVQQYLNYGIPRSKLMLGVPFYVREWKLDANGQIVKDSNGEYVSRAVIMSQVPKLIADKGAVGTYDPEFGQTKYKYYENGYTYVFWSETANTILERISIAQQYDLAGVAFWRLGYEITDLWTSMLRKK